MTALKQIRWTAIALLFIGFALAYGSGRVEHEALASSEGQFAHLAAVMAGKLFTIAAILILVWAIEWQRAKTSARLTALEEEILVMRQQLHAMTQPPVH